MIEEKIDALIAAMDKLTAAVGKAPAAPAAKAEKPAPEKAAPKPEKAAPKPEKAAPKPEAPTTDAPTRKQVAEALAAVMKAQGQAAGVAILKDHGASRVPDLDDSKYADVIAAAQEALG